jgi:hypothetical protein
VPPEARLCAALDAAPDPVVLWWRDDDAGRDHPRLARLLALAEARRAPACLAVVPDWLSGPCARRIRAAAGVTVLQHGIAHADHSIPPHRKIELGGAADRRRLHDGLRHGRERLARELGARFAPVLVPPWNRIAPDLVPALPALGFAALSTYGRRPAVPPAPGLLQVNTHVDLIAWREGGRALALSEVVDQLAALIASARDEPIGILSHHLVMDDAAFGTLDRVLALVLDHPRVRWVPAGALFGEG